MKNRFYTTNKDIENAIEKLENLGYVRLPDCKIDDTKELTKVIIDYQTNTFWLLDQMCFEGNIHTIKNQFNEELHQFDFCELRAQEEESIGFYAEVERVQLKELRDNLASKAMQNLIIVYDGNWNEKAAKQAYSIADSMLEAREL